MRRDGPIYESLIGVADLAVAEAYWQEMGYYRVAEGALDAAGAARQYGWPQALRSIRMQSGDQADYGLVRLMEWDRLRPERLADWPFMAYGSRWSAHNVVDDVDLYDNYLDGVANGEPWIVHAMTRDYSGPEGDRPGSFDRRFVGFREFSITGPETRQVFISRYRRDRPGYGTNQPPRGVSESTHYGLSTPVDANLDWYTQVLGFTIERRHDITTGSTARFTMELLPGQAVAYTKLASDRAPIGILYHFQPRWIAPDARPWARPGGAGMVAFSFRQPALDGLRADSIAAGCRDVSEIEPNEFGEPSFRLESPDGAVWALVGDE